MTFRAEDSGEKGGRIISKSSWTNRQDISFTSGPRVGELWEKKRATSEGFKKRVN